MALTKSKAAITQMTASGTSTTLDVSGSYSQTLLLNHSNGTGTVTASATVAVQVKASAGARWYTLTTWSPSLTAAQVDQIPVAIPDAVASIQLVYTAPTGPTGVALDAEVATIPSL